LSGEELAALMPAAGRRARIPAFVIARVIGVLATGHQSLEMVRANREKITSAVHICTPYRSDATRGVTYISVQRQTGRVIIGMRRGIPFLGFDIAATMIRE